MALPSAPGVPTFSSLRDTSVTVTWAPPANDGGKPILEYTVFWSTDPPRPSGSATSADNVRNISGLAPSTTYYVWVDARNADGWSPNSPLGTVRTYSNWTLPRPPARPVLTVRSSTEIELDWGGDGESYDHPVDDREYWGSSNQTPTNRRDYAANYVWSGLTPGRTYYFWARKHTRVGWSDYSSMASATTFDVPPAPDPPSIYGIAQTLVKAGFTDNGNGGTAITDRQVGYSKSTSGPITWVDYPNANITIYDLDPGTRYYFWSRVRNSVGWSPNSGRVQADTIAGAYVLVGTSWKKAVPYVKVNGVWRVARPWTKIAGVWKENSS